MKRIARVLGITLVLLAVVLVSLPFLINANQFRPMLASRTLQGIRPLEGVGTGDLHFPPVVGLRPDNRNPPVSEPIGKHVFDDCSHLCLLAGISRVLHLH